MRRCHGRELIASGPESADVHSHVTVRGRTRRAYQVAGVSRPADVDGVMEPTAGDLAGATPSVRETRGPLSSISAWVDRHGPAGWLVFVALFVAQVAWCHLVLWTTGRLAVGSIDPNILIFAVYAPYSL